MCRGVVVKKGQSVNWILRIANASRRTKEHECDVDACRAKSTMLVGEAQLPVRS